MEAEKRVSLCTLRTGGDVFGIETGAVREALLQCELREAPLAPGFVAGVLAYRGEVLVAVSFRALMGLPAKAEASSAVVLQDGESGEMFALLMDELVDVVQVDAGSWEPNPALLEARQRLIFNGAYRMEGAPVVRLETERVQPSWLMRSAEVWR